MRRAIIFFGCFLVVAGNAWAQLGENRRPSSPQLRPNLQMVQSFDSWFQNQRDRQQQQHTRYRLESLKLPPHLPAYTYGPYGQRPIRSLPKPRQDFDRWYHQQRQESWQQHERNRLEALQHEWNQRPRFREYDRLRPGSFQPY